MCLCKKAFVSLGSPIYTVIMISSYRSSIFAQKTTTGLFWSLPSSFRLLCLSVTLTSNQCLSFPIKRGMGIMSDVNNESHNALLLHANKVVNRDLMLFPFETLCLAVLFPC